MPTFPLSLRPNRPTHRYSIGAIYTILCNEPQKHCSSQTTFVLSTIAVLNTWTDCLAKRRADGANVAWTEQLLELINQTSCDLKPTVEVNFKYACKDVDTSCQTRPGSGVKMELANAKAMLIIGIPKSSTLYGTVSAIFMTRLENTFTQNYVQATSARATAAEDGDWANMALPLRSHGHAIDIAQ